MWCEGVYGLEIVCVGDDGGELFELIELSYEVSLKCVLVFCWRWKGELIVFCRFVFVSWLRVIVLIWYIIGFFDFN